MTGLKTFSFRSLSGVQYKTPGLATGYIQFIISGSQESKRGVSGAVKAENTILFSQRKALLMPVFKTFAECRIFHSGDSQPVPPARRIRYRGISKRNSFIQEII